MNLKKSDANLGVIVARFQLAELHEMHKDLIDTVLKTHARVLIVLGVAPIVATTNNPLPYQPRRQLLLEAYPPSNHPNISIAHIKDINDDFKWSTKLDGIIQAELGPSDKAVLYGSRDSFIQYYKGRFETAELESDRVMSASEIRKNIQAAPQSHPLFRMGVIWAAAQRFPTSYQCVDIAPLEKTNGIVTKVMLARKPDETKFRFIGGFVDPSDISLEYAAARELSEETGGSLSCGGAPGMTYIGSHRVDDWRYRNEKDKIMTTLFSCVKQSGFATASDDIAEVRWFEVDTLDDTVFVEEHKPLFALLAKSFTTQK